MSDPLSHKNRMRYGGDMQGKARQPLCTPGVRQNLAGTSRMDGAIRLPTDARPVESADRFRS